MGETSRLTARGYRAIWFSVVACLVLVLDQTTKLAVRSVLSVGERREFIPGVLDLLYVRNDGAAFSIGRGAGVVFVAIAALVVVGAFLLVWKQDLPMPLVVSIACVAGGGVGNMIDRLAAGYVTDFLATTFIDFPVFNVADIFVTVGVVASLVGYNIWDSRRQKARG
ncbi:MAG: signal peptidase II [Coriobacteriaceae bacterium]|nr:signal peptidase II [Olsenella sp.]MCI1288773.1 signal peptidase II [Olsenella sp.]RRF91234.1 MAG: signal peptidase II [Coriobacteriaceae bacterium]